MKYFVIAVLLLTAYYEFTFSRALWRKKNHGGAVGIMIITLLSVAIPIMIIYRE
ncbi:MAG: hypothetical protein N2645_21665 [Clostridia bacterium]|nr:hypothetical protein [Clostridia bacterium]